MCLQNWRLSLRIDQNADTYMRIGKRPLFKIGGFRCPVPDLMNRYHCKSGKSPIIINRTFRSKLREHGHQ